MRLPKWDYQLSHVKSSYWNVKTLYNFFIIIIVCMYVLGV